MATTRRRDGRGYLAVALLGAAFCGGPAAWAVPAAYDSGITGIAENYVIAAGRAGYHGRCSEAVAYDNKALAISASDGVALLDLSFHEMNCGLYAKARDHLDKVIAMHPDDMGVGLDGALLALRQGDGAGALAAIKHALTLPLFSSWHEGAAGNVRYQVGGHTEAVADEYGSIANQLLHNDEASLADMQAMLRLETEHPEYILAAYCDTAAVAGLLASAELACQESIAQNPHDIGQYDSLGYVHVRLKQWGKAIADYNKAISDMPDLVTSLYGRGVARIAIGDLAGGNADIAAARRDEPDVGAIMRRLGVGL